MGSTFYYIPNSNSLVHHGVKGQKWGERRYQNSDGSLTPEGYKHWGVSPEGGKRITATGRGKNAVKIANAITKRNKQQAKLDKAVKKAEKSGDKVAISKAKKDAKAFRDQGKGFTKSMQQSLKGTSQSDLNRYLKKSNGIKYNVAMTLGAVGGVTLTALATGGTAMVPIAIGGMTGLGAGAAGDAVRRGRQNKRIRNTVASLNLS